MFPSPKVGNQVKISGEGRGVICADVSENFGFSMYEIHLQNGKTVTEARYRFDITGPGRNSRVNERNGSKKRSFRDVRQRLDGSDEFDGKFNNWMSANHEEIQQFIKAQENRNTAKETNSNMTTLAKWLENNRGETRP